MITLKIKDYEGTIIGQWKWDESWLIPQKGDVLCLPPKDNSEEEIEVTVIDRYIRINCPGDIILITDYPNY